MWSSGAMPKLVDYDGVRPQDGLDHPARGVVGQSPLRRGGDAAMALAGPPAAPLCPAHSIFLSKP